MFSHIGTSSTMRGVFETIRRAAQVDSPVVIWGERGVGKRTAAESIHQQSRRASGPLVVIPTEEISDAAAERLMFGGPLQAVASRNLDGQNGWSGALGGTLLIKEVTELANTTQARLLKEMDERGSVPSVLHDGVAMGLRLLTTTCYDPAESVRRGTLREDLYYRLAVVAIHIPSLADRREDIPRLIGHMLGELCGAVGRPVPSVEPALMERLTQREWPGNLDELRECLASLLSAHGGPTLKAEDLPRSVLDEDNDLGFLTRPAETDATLAELERKAVTRALGAHQGNRTQAAKALGISVRTLQRKLKQWET